MSKSDRLFSLTTENESEPTDHQTHYFTPTEFCIKECSSHKLVSSTTYNELIEKFRRMHKVKVGG